jgi:hypothetical protein
MSAKSPTKQCQVLDQVAKVEGCMLSCLEEDKSARITIGARAGVGGVSTEKAGTLGSGGISMGGGLLIGSSVVTTPHAAACMSSCLQSSMSDAFNCK